MIAGCGSQLAHWPRVGNAITIAAPTTPSPIVSSIPVRLMRSRSSSATLGSRGSYDAERRDAIHAAISEKVTMKPGHQNDPRPQVSHHPPSRLSQSPPGADGSTGTE